MSPIGVKKAIRDKGVCIGCQKNKPIFQGTTTQAYCKDCAGKAPPKVAVTNTTPTDGRARNIIPLREGDTEDGEGSDSV